MDQVRAKRAGGALYRPLLEAKLTPEDVKKAREELNETAEVKASCLKELKEMLGNEKDLKIRLDDDFLVRFLRTRKFNTERAYGLLKDHYRYRAKHPSLFPLPSRIETLLRRNIFNYLPHRDSKGRAIFIMKICNWIPNDFSFKEFIAAGNMISEFVSENDVTQINGFVGIWDFKEYNFQQFISSCTPRLMWMLCSLMQDCFPGRFKLAYCVNCPALSETVWTLFKPLIKEKYRKRVLVFGNNLSLLHQHIHPSILPREYGGEMEPSDCTDLVNRIVAKEDMFINNRKYGYIQLSSSKSMQQISSEDNGS